MDLDVYYRPLHCGFNTTWPDQSSKVTKKAKLITLNCTNYSPVWLLLESPPTTETSRLAGGKWGFIIQDNWVLIKGAADLNSSDWLKIKGHLLLPALPITMSRNSSQTAGAKRSDTVWRQFIRLRMFSRMTTPLSSFQYTVHAWHPSRLIHPQALNYSV